MSNRLITALLFAAATWCQVAAQPQPPESVTLESEMTRAAGAISSYLNAVNEKKIKVGTFVETRGRASGGKQLTLMLQKKLEATGIECVRRGLESDYFVHGKYRTSQQPSDDLHALHITLVVEDKNEEQVKDLRLGVYNIEDIAKVMGFSASIPVVKEQPRTVPDPPPAKAAQSTSSTKKLENGHQPEQLLSLDPIPVTKSEEDQQRHKALAESTKKPTTVVTRNGDEKFKRSKIRATDKSPYAVEIWVRTKKGVPHEPRSIEEVIAGRPYVRVEKGESFWIKVYNESGYDAAVSVAIDGVSIFEFTQVAAFKKTDAWIINRGTAAHIQGWHLDQLGDGKQKVAEFTSGKFSGSPAAELAVDNETIGTITVQFRAAWLPSESLPPPSLAGQERAVVKGETRIVKAKEVRRNIGKVREVVSIRYEKPGTNHPEDTP